ncbi:saccharopine dehydrogenase family protein [Ignatzschineria sp. LJL83]
MQDNSFTENSAPFNVLILGGYGNFGELISTALSQKDNPQNRHIQIMIAGRNKEKAKALAEKLQCDYLVVDVETENLAECFQKNKIDLVISTVGPFQGQSYHIAKSAIKEKCHYIDLADSREFVAGITELNSLAQENNLFICSGASTVPGLSSAVVDHYLPQFSELDSIEASLSASEKVPGISTLSAVLSYAGKPFTTWKNGKWQTIYGLQNLEHHQFLHLPKKRWISNCNVPDLAIFPEQYPSVKNISFKAGVGIGFVQFCSASIAFLRRYQLFPNPVKYAGIFYKISQKFERFGDGLSGMQILLKGKDQDHQPLTICWEIIGYNNEGPNIPCFASIILARKLANNQLSKRGAFSSVHLITLEEYLAELETLDIKTFVEFSPSANSKGTSR